MTLLLALYSLLMELATWLALVPWTLVRRLMGRAPACELGERLGRLPDLPRAPGPSRRVLIHAVSVGEMAAAAALVRSLERLSPELEIMLTAGNRHGARAARRIADASARVISVSYLPWDRRRAVARWLARLKPDLVVIVETEIWPNLFLACHQRGLRLCMVNGRIYPADLPRYRLARRFFRAVLAGVDWFGVQSVRDKDRFSAIGADPQKIDVEANLKYDAVRQPLAPPAPFPSGRRILLAGSTHAPEEAQLLDVFARLRTRWPDLLLVLAPRHPSRARRIARLARRAGFSVRLASQIGVAADCHVMVVDQMGLLPSLYPHADLAFVGGSLAPRGGHNPLEPASAGRCVVIGPDYRHFEDVVEDLRAAGGILVLSGPEELEPTLARALEDESLRTTVGRNAQATTLAKAGCADRYARKLTSFL